MSKVIIVSKENSEFEMLVNSLGYTIVAKVYIKNNKPNPSYYISEGKIKELKDLIKELKPEKVIIDAILKASQWYKLEKTLKIPVNDRIKLIIDIFADRAKTKEAMMQVEYANLKYEISHVREIVHRIKLGEHPGFMAGGEYQIADYYERIRKRMSKIRKELEKLRMQRRERRKRRREEGYILVGIAGYTNTGKSTLLKALSGKNILIENRMFSTLTTKTSKISNEKILITDTVGFIENMPPWLIQAFEPTLEEIYEADIVLLLLDCKDNIKKFKDKLLLSLDILQGKVKGKIIPIINKIDLCNDIDSKIEIVRDIREPLIISAKKGIGLDEIIKEIKKEMNIQRFYAEVKKDSKLYKFIITQGKIIKISGSENLRILFELPISKYNTINLLSIKNSTRNEGVLKKI